MLGRGPAVAGGGGRGLDGGAAAAGVGAAVTGATVGGRDDEGAGAGAGWAVAEPPRH